MQMKTSLRGQGSEESGLSQARASSLRGRESYLADVSLVFTRKFRTIDFRIPLLGEADTAVRLGTESRGVYHKGFHLGLLVFSTGEPTTVDNIVALENALSWGPFVLRDCL